MDSSFWIEVFGYIGSAIVVISLLMTSVVKLRLLNMIGSLICMIYAAIIHSYPVVGMNAILIVINIFQLVRLLGKRGTQKHFDLIKTSMDDACIAYLLHHNEADIRAWFPDFAPDAVKADVAYLVCCDQAPAGLLLGRAAGQASLEILLDYALPMYRDTSVGVFLYDRLAEEGYQQLTFSGRAPKHIDYMKRMGFEQRDGAGYVKLLDKAR